MADRSLKILVAKPGLDGHDRGIKVLARAFQEAGMKVVYLGLRQTAQKVVDQAIIERPDVIAISILSGAHLVFFKKLMALLKQQALTRNLVMAGGIIPEEDVPKLEAFGVNRIFGPGAHVDEIIAYIRAHAG